MLIAAAVLVYSLWQPPQYAAEMTLLIVPRPGISDDEGDALNAMNSLDRRTLSENFAQVVRSRTTMEKASAEVQMDLMAMQSSGALDMEVTVIPGTSVIRIVVKANNPEQAANITNAIGNQAIQVANSLQSYPYVLQVLDTVSVPREPVGASLVTSGILGLAVGALTGFGVAFAVDYIDQTRVRGSYRRASS